MEENITSYELRINTFRLAPFARHRLEVTRFDLRFTIYDRNGERFKTKKKELSGFLFLPIFKFNGDRFNVNIF